jgi:8-oxo-dGTP pyrophosphatase MutT (NUDIX family)
LLAEEWIARQLRAAYQSGVAAPADIGLDEGEGGVFKCAAVLLPLVRQDDEWQLVFTRRTDTVEHHKGQVSFPGGGCEAGEDSPEATALREAREEIGLHPQDVRLLGRMNDLLTITHYRVTPVVGVMPWPYRFELEAAEVERVFTIPLAWLAERSNWEQRPFTPGGLKRSFPVLIYHPYDGETLWGITARITQDFLVTLGLLK